MLGNRKGKIHICMFYRGKQKRGNFRAHLPLVFYILRGAVPDSYLLLVEYPIYYLVDNELRLGHELF